jgi:hypothetical protein
MSRPFSDFLKDLANGLTVAQLTEQMAELVVAVGETGKRGTITLVLTLEPNAAGTVRIIDEIKTKIPQAARGASIFYSDDAGDLLRRDPRQTEMGFRDVSAEKPAAETRQAATGERIPIRQTVDA